MFPLHLFTQHMKMLFSNYIMIWHPFIAIPLDYELRTQENGRETKQGIWYDFLSECAIPGKQ